MAALDESRPSARTSEKLFLSDGFAPESSPSSRIANASYFGNVELISKTKSNLIDLFLVDYTTG